MCAGNSIAELQNDITKCHLCCVFFLKLDIVHFNVYTEPFEEIPNRC